MTTAFNARTLPGPVSFARRAVYGDGRQRQSRHLSGAASDI